jgi:NAD(P)H-flavin reductase
MLKTQFTLIAKRSLTHDVYELVYSCPDIAKESPKPGQYVMFQLAPGLNRSYSLASFTPDSFTLVIKRVVEGKGSSIICDAPIGQVFSGMLPLGHFVLRDTIVPKCFIGTGT